MTDCSEQREALDHEAESDVERLERALAACQDLQDLAVKYGIGDIFPDAHRAWIENRSWARRERRT